MKNLFQVGQTVIFKSPINAAITTKVIDLKYSELSKTYLYKLECRKGVFFSEACLSKVVPTFDEVLDMEEDAPARVDVEYTEEQIKILEYYYEEQKRQQQLD